MKKVLVSICILAFIFLINACSNDKVESTLNQPTDTGTVVNIEENEPASSDNSSRNNKANIGWNINDALSNRETDNSLSDDEINGTEIPQIYIDYVKQLDPDSEDDICFFADDDMDLDGVNEIIIGTGTSGEDPSGNYVSHLYILSNEDGVINQFGDNLSMSGYAVYQVKLIQMQDDPRKYLYCGLTNGASLTGFRVIGLENSTPYDICYSASPTGAGSDELMDFDNDGLYDGYTEYRWSYDVLYYPLIRTYVFENNTFRLVSTDIYLSDYPESVEDVILEYLSLSLLADQGTEEVNQRLAELCSDGNVNRTDFLGTGLFRALFDKVMGFPDGIECSIDEQTDTADSEVSFLNEDGVMHKFYFELQKSNDKWTITAIEKR